MSDIRLNIDGQDLTAPAGATVLEAARAAGIAIPTLCQHEGLKPFGGCRVCLVEAGPEDKPRLIAACVYPAEEGLEVRTRTPKVDRIRKNVIELLLAHAPDAPILKELAAEYGADRDRFEADASFCIHCGLCVRYCAEVKGAHAVGFIDRGVRKEICFIPSIAAQVCNDCKACFPLCPTSYLQAAFVLVESMAFPDPKRS